MKQKLAILTLVIMGSLLLINLLGKNRQSRLATQKQTLTQAEQNNQSTNLSVAPADKIEVVHFHGTKQCVSCLTVGQLTKQTIEEKFSAEVTSGKIIFKEINGELPENEAIVTKYQARGSSLFINAIRGEQEDITEDVTVWQLINNQKQFTTYLENKLNKLLGK